MNAMGMDSEMTPVIGTTWSLLQFNEHSPMHEGFPNRRSPVETTPLDFDPLARIAELEAAIKAHRDAVEHIYAESKHDHDLWETLDG